MKISFIRVLLPAVAVAGLLAGGVTTAAAAPTSSNSGTDGSNLVVGPRGQLEPGPSKTSDKNKKDYLNCEQVWSDGKGPIYPGQPGYSVLLDPGGTGVACAH
ncbi:excalibur calcium-binding domain-containing protein [Nocardia sp. alder85J]|uniref:excalibur calcium-binding domain-containing protein n=1 Tax=Nocardia sp. alder85J TaxID=2862949 RepID=UPI001CD33E36|nr:excalibur calcium-binding domain-containing protein [Nocardia sp. alder85J]MCX4098928.1 excalibur calcium-binding domain-containing protein [Nocardia sp. alder85J]